MEPLEQCSSEPDPRIDLKNNLKNIYKMNISVINQQSEKNTDFKYVAVFQSQLLSFPETEPVR